jgi:uncharacterized spore protein YtfJ
MSDAVTVSRKQQQVDQAINGSTDTFVHRLAEALGGTASAAAAYGQAVEREGVTVIPVAKVRWGVGGGSGTGTTMDKLGGGGSGGAGGTVVSPIGYIEIHDGEAEFRRIREQVPPWMLPPVLLAGTLGVCGVLLAFVVLNGLAPFFNGLGTGLGSGPLSRLGSVRPPLPTSGNKR